jgi:hypothetical protein
MTKNERTNLEAAINRLDAVRISTFRYAYYADETRTYWVVSRKSMINLGERLNRGDRDAYSFWCGETYAREGWKP